MPDVVNLTLKLLYMKLHVLLSVTSDQHMEGKKGEPVIPYLCPRVQHYLARSVNGYSAAPLFIFLIH